MDLIYNSFYWKILVKPRRHIAKYVHENAITNITKTAEQIYQLWQIWEFPLTIYSLFTPVRILCCNDLVEDITQKPIMPFTKVWQLIKLASILLEAKRTGKSRPLSHIAHLCNQMFYDVSLNDAPFKQDIYYVLYLHVYCFW